MRLGVFSTMFGSPWGGSEELWSRAATTLLCEGHGVSININRRSRAAPQLRRLEELGGRCHFRGGVSLGRSATRLLQRIRVVSPPHKNWLVRARPDFVLASIGSHADDVSIATTCRTLGVPYALLLQAASPYQWLDKRQRETHRAAYAGAARCFFVSSQNRDVMEANLAIDLSESRIVDNPFTVSPAAAPPWPADNDHWKLACVARLYFQAKGQDLLLQSLRHEKWRSRPLEITLWGDDGGHRRHIEQLTTLYGLERHVKIGGFAENIESLWAQHHGLVLPSRYEGNPLALTEAMLCGRMPIVTNVGRAAELVDDNRTGFLAPAATVELVDDALERAWQRRREWQSMGALAAQAIRQRHSLQPGEDFANELLATAKSRPAMLARAA